ncbi:hypothetical protein ACN9ML_11855 [Dyadobacter endophyticus]
MTRSNCLFQIPVYDYRLAHSIQFLLDHIRQLLFVVFFVAGN